MEKTILSISKNCVSKVFKTDYILSHETAFSCCIHTGYKKRMAYSLLTNMNSYMLKNKLLLKM